MKEIKRIKKLVITLFLAVLFDQVLKVLVSYYMDPGQSVSLIPNFFSLTSARNIGAAFSILSGGRILLIILGIIAIDAIYLLFIYNKELTKKDQILYGLLMGGILGNLLDRIFYGYVVDYLDFKIFGYDFPIFNLADILITISVILIIIFSFKVKNGTSSKQK
jgi:signal peptidase II